MPNNPQITRRPKAYPPPEFPPRQPRLFARTPPAVFPAILGLLGLGLALRKGCAVAGLDGGLVEMALGAVLALWAAAALALLIKIARRPAVVIDDLKVLPGRSGLASATMGAMAAAMVVVPYAPTVALALALAGVILHAVLAVLLVRVLLAGPNEMRGVNPSWHLSFVGFIVASLALVPLGWMDLAVLIFWLTMPVAAAIWGLSMAQLIGRIPPAPLRPLLAIHLSPAALFSLVAVATGQAMLAESLALFGAVLLAALVFGAAWVTKAGFSPFWGAFTFPLAAYASALLSLGGAWQRAGFGLLALATPVIVTIAWKVLKLWPGGRLAAKTNAAEA